MSKPPDLGAGPMPGKRPHHGAADRAEPRRAAAVREPAAGHLNDVLEVSARHLGKVDVTGQQQQPRRPLFFQQGQEPALRPREVAPRFHEAVRRQHLHRREHDGEVGLRRAQGVLEPAPLRLAQHVAVVVRAQAKPDTGEPDPRGDHGRQRDGGPPADRWDPVVIPE